MFRLAFALLCYLTALVSIYAAFQVAPDMKWPVTQTEWLAAHLLIIGASAKLLGHALILLPRRVPCQ